MYSPQKEQRNPISCKNKIKVDGLERKPFEKNWDFPVRFHNASVN